MINNKYKLVTVIKLIYSVNINNVMYSANIKFIFDLLDINLFQSIICYIQLI